MRYFRPLGFLAVALLMAAGCARQEPEVVVAARVTLITPAQETIERGESEQITLALDRDGFTGPVNLTLGKLPKGVEVTDRNLTFGPDARAVTFTVRASEDAELVKDFPVTVTADAGNLPALTETFRLTVRGDQKDQGDQKEENASEKG